MKLLQNNVMTVTVRMRQGSDFSASEYHYNIDLKAVAADFDSLKDAEEFITSKILQEFRVTRTADELRRKDWIREQQGGRAE